MLLLALNKTMSTLPHKEGKYWQGLIDKTYTITDKVHCSLLAADKNEVLAICLIH